MDPGLEGENEKTGKYVIEYCFRDALSGCQTCDTTNVYVVKLPEISFDALPKQCINNPLLALDSFVKDRNTEQRFPNGTWEAIEYGGSRDMSDPNVGPKLQKAVVGKKYFDPSAGPGQYLLKLTDVSSGCPVSDSTEILVNGLPIIQIDVPDTVCSSSAPFTLNNLNPSGNVGKWSGPGVTGRDFDPAISGKTKQYEGPYQVKFEYTNPLTGCTKADSQTLLVQSQPEVNIYNPSPYQQCEDQIFDLKAGKKWARNTKWTPVNGFGQFRTPNDTNSIYDQAFNDTALNSLNGKLRLRIATLKEGVCPVATDEIDLILEPYPQFDFSADPVIQCEPATVNFSSSIRKPAGSPNLRYNWWFGNGESIANSTTFNPQNILYDTAKRNWYDITLLVENRWGGNPGDVCSIRKDSIGYVKVLPQPKAGFSSDPGFFTTVAFPKFKFFNETKIRWTNNGKMDYLWYFGTGDLDDTSTQVHPIYSYVDDTAKYYVHLTSTYTYYDPITMQDYTCWDTISQLRKIGPDVTVFVPTAFSPEGTGPGTNNVFMAVVNGEKTFHIELFNRWGELLWQTDDKYKAWDGRYMGEDVQQDVYIWHIRVIGFDGLEYLYEGTVTLMR
jgi:gliding motility-associated-like protein